MFSDTGDVGVDFGLRVFVDDYRVESAVSDAVLYLFPQFSIEGKLPVQESVADDSKRPDVVLKLSFTVYYVFYVFKIDVELP
eukprot:CAMPEP_0116919194 /NCGR_PEP_ID=MMETSP0467-20121206/20233_1 /TAXON_ID=283647 /ORGANISM="Mesodinium pulex, Strain SPMC105" /LENGTH=81 /DNA_ID=CAMNT_0004596711 /DNA_START=654 /DNA_END=899 /DNA_ORIENTATION=-